MSKERAKAVIKKISENLGKGKKIVVSKAMRESGFSPSYCEQPQQFTNTKTYKELMKEYLPDELITKRHNELLNASAIQHYVFPKLSDTRGGRKKGKTIKKNELTNEEIQQIVESVPGCRLIYIKPDFYAGKIAFFQSPDGKVRKDAVDMAYKVYGAYAAEKIAFVDPLDELTNAELSELEKQLIAKIKNRK